MKTISTFAIGFIFLTLIISACDSRDRHSRLLNEIMEADREFSRLSIEVGAHESFLAYINDSCVLLRPNRLPVVGREKIEDMYCKPDTSFTLSWEPLAGDISSSGDLGYTYGIYTIYMDSPEGVQVKKEGTYVTIWKREPDGNWKFVLDSGNQGLGGQKEETE